MMGVMALITAATDVAFNWENKERPRTRARSAYDQSWTRGTANYR